jgi:hypothetical protein
MRLGITEMLMVGVVIMLIIGLSRFFPMKSRQPALPAKPSRPLTPTEARDEEILARRRQSKVKFFPVVIVILGVLIVLGAPSLLKYFFMSYIGGGLIIIIGLASLFMISRRS